MGAPSELVGGSIVVPSGSPMEFLSSKIVRALSSSSTKLS
jgi:hypothetical protein